MKEIMKQLMTGNDLEATIGSAVVDAIRAQQFLMEIDVFPRIMDDQNSTKLLAAQARKFFKRAAEKANSILGLDEKQPPVIQYRLLWKELMGTFGGSILVPFSGKVTNDFSEVAEELKYKRDQLRVSSVMIEARIASAEPWWVPDDDSKIGDDSKIIPNMLQLHLKS